jgi:hypothetical protein
MRQVDQLRTPVPACFTDKDPFDRPREHEVKHRRHRVGVTQVGALDAKVGGPEYRAHLAQGQPGARDARVGIANPIDAVERRGDEESHGAVSRLPGAGGENRLSAFQSATTNVHGPWPSARTSSPGMSLIVITVLDRVMTSAPSGRWLLPQSFCNAAATRDLAPRPPRARPLAYRRGARTAWSGSHRAPG